MIRRHTLFRVLVLLVVLLLPASFAAAQSADDDGTFVLQVNQPVSVGAGQVIDSVVIFDDTVTIDGRVAESLWVINGDAVVNGEVPGDVVVFSGTLTLGPEATVGNVSLFSSDMTRADGAMITGDLHDGATTQMLTGAMAFFSVAFWIGTAIVTVLVGLAFVALAGRLLARSTETIMERPLESGVTGFATWVVLPILAIVAFVSLIGIPVGLAIVLVVIPLLALLGYIVAAFFVGTWLAALAKIEAGRYLVVVAGVIALQLLGLVPWLGGLVVFVATMLGTGALLYRLWHDRRDPAPARTSVAPMEGHAHA